MIFHINPINVFSGLHAMIDGDSTLEGATYLTSSGRIWSRRRPANGAYPCLVITMLPLVPGPMQVYNTEVRVHCYTALLGSGQIDSTGDRILDRCEELMNNVTPTVTDAQAQPLYSRGIVLSYVEPTEQSTAHGVLRLSLDIGPTA